MCSALSLLPILLPTIAGAASLEVGDPAPGLSLKDQHDQAHTLEGARVVLFSSDRDGSNLADDLLEGQNSETLAQAGLCYVADISAMPGMVTSMFALPKLRKRSYSVLLGRQAEDTLIFPRQSGHLTLVSITDGQITAIEILADAASIRARLGWDAQPA